MGISYSKAPLISEPDGVTIRQAADIFGVSPCTIRNWIKDGKLPAVKRPSGMVWYIPKDALNLPPETMKGE